MLKCRDYSAVFPLPFKTMWAILRRVRVDENGCWLWTGPCCNFGYGRVTIHGRIWAVHRVMYEHFTGHIPEGFVVHHTCRVTSCCNPLHLEAMTQASNVRHAHIPAGIRHYLGRLTHCKRGHLLLGDNVQYRFDRHHLSRVCRTCAAPRVANYRKRKLARAKAAKAAARIKGVPAPGIS